MTALAEAFARVGYQHRAPVAGADPRIASRASRSELTRERLREKAAEYAAMTDADLAVEATALEQDTENIRVNLHAEYKHETQRGIPWQLSAERALSALKGELKFCNEEIARRNKARKLADAEAAEIRRQADIQLGRQRRAEEDAQRLSIRLQTEIEVARDKLARAREWERVFVQEARRLLPVETWQTIVSATHMAMGRD